MEIVDVVHTSKYHTAEARGFSLNLSVPFLLDQVEYYLPIFACVSECLLH